MEGSAVTPKRVVPRSHVDAAPLKPIPPGYGRQIRKLLDVHHVLRSGRCLHCEWMRESPIVEFLKVDRPFYHPGSPRETPDSIVHTTNPKLRRKCVRQPKFIADDDSGFKRERNKATNVNRKEKVSKRLPKVKSSSPSYSGTAEFGEKRQRVTGGPIAPLNHPEAPVTGTSTQADPFAAVNGLVGSALESHSWTSNGTPFDPQIGMHPGSIVGSLTPSKSLTRWATNSLPSSSTPCSQPPLAPAAYYSPVKVEMSAVTPTHTPSTPPSLSESHHVSPTLFSATTYQPSRLRKLELPVAPAADATTSPSSGVEAGELFEEQSVWSDLLAGFEAENQSFSNMTGSSSWDPSLPYFSTSEADNPFFSSGELERMGPGLDYQEGQGWPLSLQ